MIRYEIRVCNEIVMVELNPDKMGINAQDLISSESGGIWYLVIVRIGGKN
jgi:hypothetical protein